MQKEKNVYKELLRLWEAGTSKMLPLPEGSMNDPVVEWFEANLTEKEAKFLLTLPIADNEMPRNVATIAHEAGMKKEEAASMLKALMDKAMVVDYIEGREEERLYSLAHWIMWGENYYHRYVDTKDANPQEIVVKLSRWFEEVKKSDQFKEGQANYFRVIPINKTIQDVRSPISLAQVSNILEGSAYITVKRCFCRTPSHLIGSSCDNPLEVCFNLGDYGRYQVENGFARKVSREWALETFKECEERGLIHVTDNIKGPHRVICNCCPCHCLVLSGWTQGKSASRAAKSDFINSVNLDKCQGLGLCVEKCPFNAMELKNGKAWVNEDRCIGCGFCISSCPHHALSLRERPLEKTDIRYENIEEYTSKLGIKNRFT